jgi:acetylcholinesterase
MQSLNIGWRPYIDGIFLTAPPHQLILDGKIAHVPFITGDAEDEATMFSLSATNVTHVASSLILLPVADAYRTRTSDELKAYLASNAIPAFNESGIDDLLALYSSNPAAGSPFGTGDANAITPEYKRMAALIGDTYVQAPRRFLLDERSDKQLAYSFRASLTFTLVCIACNTHFPQCTAGSRTRLISALWVAHLAFSLDD